MGFRKRTFHHSCMGENVANLMAKYVKLLLK